MITRALAALKEVFIPKSEDIVVNMDGGVGGSWRVECSSDDTAIDCEDLQENYEETPYTGVPAPDYLQDDPWFSAPVLSEKQVTYKEAHEQAVAEQQILDESAEGESSNIHQKLYDLATANWNTVAQAQAQYQGGSENFHEGPGGWTSGNGFSRVSG